MTQKKSKRGAVEVFLPQEFFNSLVSVLSSYIEADETNKYSVYAQRLKKKILNYSRCFSHHGENFSATYFYEEEAALLIKLFAIYINATEENGENYYSQLEKK